jgi:protease-4
VLWAGCAPDGFLITPISADRTLQEKVLYRESLFPAGKITVVDVEGVIINAHMPGILAKGEHPVAFLLEQLDKARRDQAVKAVVLRINSPGGAVTAAELMHTEITRFREAGKPVVAMMMDVAASGGYYIACAADEIIACRSTITGSIGVIFQTFDVTGTMHKIGAKAEAIKSGPQKGAGSPFESLTPQQRAMFQGMIDELYAQFVDVVAAGRPDLSRSRVEELADGRPFTAGQALEHGLIDSIGTMPEAIEHAKKRAAVEKVAVVTYARPHGYAPNYYARQPEAPQASVNLLNLDLSSWSRSYRPPLMYLWSPP